MIMTKLKWVQSAYKTTQVHWGKTQSQILKMLEDIGIEQTRFTSLQDRFILEFMAKIDEKSVPRAIRIVIPVFTSTSADPIKRNRELNVIHRILLNHLKAKFIAIGNGLTEFESEFMAHLVITDKDGNSSTLGEKMLPEYKGYLEGGETPQFRLGSGKN